MLLYEVCGPDDVEIEQFALKLISRSQSDMSPAPPSCFTDMANITWQSTTVRLLNGCLRRSSVDTVTARYNAALAVIMKAPSSE